MMSIEDAVKLTPNTAEFEAAVEAAAEACEAREPGAERLLMLLLQKNEDFLISRVYGGGA